jgi:hypothetical protein
MAASLPRFGCQGFTAKVRVPPQRLAMRPNGRPRSALYALPAKYNGVTVSRGSREQPSPSASRSARPCPMPRDLSASYSRCAARPSQNASHIIHTAATACHEEEGGDQPARFAFRWIGSKPSVSSQFRSIFHTPDRGTGPMSCPGAMQIRHLIPWAQSIVSRACHRISHNMIHMLHIELWP